MDSLDVYKTYEIRSSFLHSKYYLLKKYHNPFTQLLKDVNLNLIAHISIFSYRAIHAFFICFEGCYVSVMKELMQLSLELTLLILEIDLF